eukprot:PhM_4_TR15907/c0_g1_i1/m.20769
MDPTIAAQRQVEVQGVLRAPVKTAEELTNIYTLVKERLLARLFPSLHRASRRSTLPLDTVFQFLLGQTVDKQGVDFDKQHGDGFVPMHQAKVLNRSNVATADVCALMDKVWTPEETSTLASDICELRTVFRMKVEDANDLSMAHKTVLLVSDYLQYIHALSKGNADKMWGFYVDGVPQDSLAMTAGGFQGALTLEGESTIPVIDANSILDVVPQYLSDITKTPVMDRIQLLQRVHRWMEGHLPDMRVLEVLTPAIETQLGDKRSQVVKLACAIIRTACVQKYFASKAMSPCSTVSSNSGGEGCEAFSPFATAVAWFARCLKQVHVTVLTISSECHSAAVHLLHYAGETSGIQFVNTLLPLIQKAPQAALKRRCLEYVGALLLHDGFVPSEAQLTTLLAVVPTMASHANVDVRRAARLVAAAAPDLYDGSVLSKSGKELDEMAKFKESDSSLISFAEGALNVSLQLSKRNSRLRSLRADSIQNIMSM